MFFVPGGCEQEPLDGLAKEPRDVRLRVAQTLAARRIEAVDRLDQRRRRHLLKIVQRLRPLTRPG
jgi:hypothetical protein